MSSVYDSMMQGLNEATEYSKGAKNARVHTIGVEPVPTFAVEDVKEACSDPNSNRQLVREA